MDLVHVPRRLRTGLRRVEAVRRGVETVDGREAREVRVVLNPDRTDELAARTEPLSHEDADAVSPLNDPAATGIRLWLSTETGLPLRIRVTVSRSRHLGPDLTGRFSDDVSYRPMTPARPNRKPSRARTPVRSPNRATLDRPSRRSAVSAHPPRVGHATLARRPVRR